MQELLLLLLQIFAEALLEVFGEALVSLSFRGLRHIFSIEGPFGRSAGLIAYTCLGMLLGLLSLLIFPHPLVPPARFHGVSLLVSPVLVGLFMSFLGSSLEKKDKTPLTIESFWYGFSFAFGMALVRLFLTR